jgi:hypothetical protein
MTDSKEEVQKQETQDRGRRCPTCAAFPKLTHKFLDPRRGKTTARAAILAWW